QILYRRLTKQQDWARQPQLDDLAIQHLIRTFVINNEKRSTTRYVANVTYVFSQGAVERLLRANGIAYAEMQGSRFLIVPMSPGYSPKSPWAMAWNDPRYGSSLVPVVPPEAGDAPALSGLNFDTAGMADVQAIVARTHAQEAVLAQASVVSGHIAVKLRRLPGGPIAPEVDVPIPPGKPAASAYPAAADAVASAIEDAWKGKAAIDFGQKSHLMLEAKISSLSDWASLQAKLGTLPIIVGVDTIAIDTGEVRFNILYAGTMDQLRNALSDAGLSLNQRAGLTWLSPSQTASQ
ncbi:MAG TPA: hypothetical protein VK779_08885, partial [Rhizomicrobium sp.]|nr:hypothetical protein [Rhizomicrobium sp.]